MNNNLKKLNFDDLIILDSKVNLDTYDFNKYSENGIHPLKGYCLRCEEKGCNICPDDDNFRLLNISHGASTDDFLQATKQTDLDISEWHEEGVMFLMEGPSIDGWSLYGDIEFNGHRKRPAQLWYWIHYKQEALAYPNEFKGGRYGSLFNSIIFTFKLKNAYFTNLIKCGLNNMENNYKGIASYNQECIKTCNDNILQKEINIVNPKVVFCFGTSVFNYFKVLNPKFEGNVVSLPHPAGQRRGFKDEFYRHLYYSMILEGLYNAGIISKEKVKEKYGQFIDKMNE